MSLPLYAPLYFALFALNQVYLLFLCLYPLLKLCDVHLRHGASDIAR